MDIHLFYPKREVPRVVEFRQISAWDDKIVYLIVTFLQ